MATDAAAARSATGSAADFIPPRPTLSRLREAAATCRGCHLWVDATQTVFSKGSPTARVAFVGEQPGDVEDREGAPFVGPAGRLLDRAMGEAGFDRGSTYVTNAVKHFRFRTDDQIRSDLGDPGIHRAIAHELADCLWALLRLASVCDVDLASTLREKVALAAIKYPVDRSFGRNDKYTAYRDPEVAPPG